MAPGCTATDLLYSENWNALLLWHGPLRTSCFSRALSRYQRGQRGLVDGVRLTRTCLKCRSLVEVDQDGCVAAHIRPLSRLYCYASGQPASLVSVQWGPGPRQGRTTASSYKERRRGRRKAEYLKPPEWMPRYQGANVASIGLPAKGWLGVWFPAHTMWEHERKLYSWLGSDRSFRWDSRQGCWTVASDHFPRISRELLQRYPGVLIGREYNPREKCNSSCQNARGFLCTCSCRAKYHGGGSWRSGWKTLGEFSSQRAGSPWHWTAVAVAS